MHCTAVRCSAARSGAGPASRRPPPLLMTTRASCSSRSLEGSDSCSGPGPWALALVCVWRRLAPPPETACDAAPTQKLAAANGLPAWGTGGSAQCGRAGVSSAQALRRGRGRVQDSVHCVECTLVARASRGTRPGPQRTAHSASQLQAGGDVQAPHAYALLLTAQVRLWLGTAVGGRARGERAPHPLMHHSGPT